MKLNYSTFLACVGLAMVASSVSAETIREYLDAGKIVPTGAASANWLGTGDTEELVLVYTDAEDKFGQNLKIDTSLAVTVDYLVVGGGGAGGTMKATSPFGADGGDSGNVIEANDAVLQGTDYRILVGAGGIAATTTEADIPGGKGKNSSLIGGSLNAQATGGAGGGVTKTAESSFTGTDGNSAAVTSSITGSPVTYALGGKGGSGAAPAHDGAAGAANSGNGGGGSDKGYLGGNGGSGVVIIRLKSAVVRATTGPELKDLAYTGEEQTGIEPGEGYVIEEGSVLTGLNAGNYIAKITPAEGWWWADDGKTATREIVWTIKPREVEKPSVADSPFEFTGEEISVTPSTDAAYEYIDELTELTGTNAGLYPLTATLLNPENVTNFVWKGDEEYSAIATGTWQIKPILVERPVVARELTYTGEELTAVEFDLTYIDLVDLSEGKPSVTQATDAGAYAFKAVLKNPEGAENYRWADTLDAAPWYDQWKITRAPNEITRFVRSGWRIVEGEEPPAPIVEAKFGVETAVVEYAAREDAEEEEWTTTVPSEPGTWWARAYIASTPNYAGADAMTSFVVWRTPSDIYTDSVTISTGYTGEEAVTDFVIPVRLSEALPGFSYERAQAGDGLAFVCGDEILSYDVELWNPEGESIVWVKIPELTATTAITMWWHAKVGFALGGMNAAEVWSNYHGVWHFGETIEAEAAAETVTSDATGNGHAATPVSYHSDLSLLNQMVSVDGVIGKARQTTTGVYTRGPRFELADTAGLELGGKFTISGWYDMNAHSGGGAGLVLFGRKDAQNGTEGFYGQHASSSNLSIYGQGASSANASVTIRAGNPDQAGWSYFAFTYDADQLTVLLKNGADIKTASNTIAPAGDNGKTISLGSYAGNQAVAPFAGYFDEIRISKEPLSVERLKLDELSMSDPTFAKLGLVSRDGLKVNVWTSLPDIQPRRWDVADAPTFTIEKGTLKEGEVVVNYYRLEDPTTPLAIADPSEITSAGRYVAVFTMADGEGYEPIRHEIELTVTVRSPYTDISGLKGDSGRVLLMNRDLNLASPVDYQGYYDTNPEEASTYWDHVNVSEPTTYFNLMDSTESILRAKDGTALWWLKDCRQGNVFPKRDDLELPPNQNYLPWASPTALSFKGRGEAAKVRSDAGTLVMRNTGMATVYSPSFTNGVGVIYFDAVNGWTKGAAEDGADYQLTVQMTTFGMGLDPELISEDQWTEVPAVKLFKKDGTADFVEEDIEGGTFALAIKNGGTTANFYRVVIPINETKPLRFRIVRKTFDDLQYPDNNKLILLDNLIVSYPAMRADLSPTGFYDAEKRGRQVLGWEEAATTPFPAVGDENIRLRAKATAVVNDGKPGVDPRTLVASAVMHYRWRYLNQRTDPAEGWRVVALNPMDGYRATRPLELPAIEGDVEFYYETLLSAPYYTYVDYTGLDLGVPYSEEVPAVTNRYEGATLPSGGTDWFFRLRAGKSGLEAVKMIVETTEGEAHATVDFHLTRDKLWRGFLKTPEESKGTYRFRFEATEPADLDGLEPALVTNTWKALSKVTETPFAVSYAVAPKTEWAEMVVDATTGYLMFQLNEDTKTVSVAHADFQDFNRWNDAHRDGGVFVGNSTDDDKKVAASEAMRDFEERFSTWTDTPATNPYWIEGFTQADLKNFESFQSKRTPNGWLANNGMYVPEEWMVESNNHAFQMRGTGLGSIEYPGSVIDPRGLESISYRARLGQQLTFNDIAYKDVGRSTSKSMRNYTFVTQAAMSNVGWTSDHTATDFDGAGQISLVAAYQAGVGCYELRVTRIGKERCRFELYKWRTVNGTMKATLVGTAHDENRIVFHKWRANNSNPWEYGTFFISIDAVEGGGQRITAGAAHGHARFKEAPANNYNAIRFYDASSPLDYGTFGVASASCPAYFFAPRVYGESVAWDTSVQPGKDKYQGNIQLGLTSPVYEDESFDEWAIPDGRLAVFADSENRVNRWGLKALAASQKLLVQYKALKSAEWVTMAERTVSGFSLKSEMINVYRPEEGTYRIVHGGNEDEVRTDVVIDDLELRQWRGDTWGNPDTQGYCGPDDGYGYRSSFIFQTGWVKSHRVKLSAKRTLPNESSAIRSPLMDGNGGRGLGLGMISFAYVNAQENARLLIQVAAAEGSALERNLEWETVKTISFSEMTAADRASGVINHYLGLHGFKGLVRIVVDPALVEAVQSETNTRLFGEIDITSILVRDEPMANLRSWWGWNMRLINGDGSSVWDDGSRTYLPDWGVMAGDMGFSLALNNSVSANVIRDESDAYKQHMPFVQTPTFVDNIVGEVTFKARKFDTENPQAAEVTLYGANTGDPMIPDSAWEKLAHFVVSNDTYEVFHYRAAGGSYRAFRLGVTGVKDVVPGGRGDKPTEGDEPVRVMIEDVVVSEAVYPRLGFRYAYPTRTGLDDHSKSPVYDAATGVANCDEQPLLGENWTVQAEIQVKQLPEEIDLDTPGHEPRVFFHWIEKRFPWGYTWWKDEKGAHRAELLPVEGDAMTFRGSFMKTPDAIVGESSVEGSVVQYMVSVVYFDREGVMHESFIERNDWQTPAWYNPVDFNDESNDFSAFTILESIAPHRAWFNEVNIYDGRDAKNALLAENNQYVEIAVPQNQSLTGWHVEFVDNNNKIATLCTFGEGRGEVTPTKVGPATNDYTFVVVESPRTAMGTVWRNVRRPDGELVEMDGTWSSEIDDITELYPVALRLVRPSGVVAEEIALEGTNFWASMGWTDSTLEQYVIDLNEDEQFKHPTFFAVGSESQQVWATGPTGQSLGVFAETGATSNLWNSVMHQTPGWVNEGQIVPENYVIYPNLAKIVVTAKIEGKGVTQSTDGSEPTTDEIKFTVPKGGAGAELVYEIGTWHELAGIKTNDVAVAGAAGARTSYTLIVGAGADKNVSVVATAVPRADLKDYGFDPEGPYADAVMDWLDTGKNFFGEGFKNPGEIHLAEYWSIYPYAKVQDLTLTDMYNLDMDPTEGNWRLEAGVINVGTKAKPAESRMKLAIGPTGDDGEGSAAHEATENLLVTVKMTMTNTVSAASYAPYILRGRQVGETSVGHEEFATGNWNSASFKITGDLQNGNPNRTRWVPLRWFYFLPNIEKANRSASFDANNEAVIEVWDPFDEARTGTTSGWSKYRGCTILYSWTIDERTMPTQVEVLSPTSTY